MATSKKHSSDNAFSRALDGEAVSPAPVWLMRQAGRYLPEYRQTREEAGSFLDLCFDAERAARVTLQPIERFGFDAAILFADILLIPYGFGQTLRFEAGEGPVLDPPARARDLRGIAEADWRKALAPVFDTVRRVRAELDDKRALIGFCGGPWTVATYMLAGGASKDPAALRARYYEDRAFIEELLALLVDASTEYLLEQIDAGADAVQIFDSWAGGLTPELTERLSLEPMDAIARRVKQARPDAKVILFPKGVGERIADYARLEACDAVNFDFTLAPEWVREHVSPHAVAQGGLDPLLIVAGGARMEDAARRLLEAFDGAPYIFNGGHGLTPQTPIAHVEALLELIRGDA